ncbi:MAG TPA: hydantoinase/oxoprolinase family protein [Spirochaetota bacterium]|nr:hydantoinase/oxoprolinase family protein [Spirochaetota bacterium]
MTSAEPIHKVIRTGIGLGIDAGGTYTDSVVYDFTEDRVAGWAKAPTTHDDYAVGIQRSLKFLFEQVPKQLIKKIGLVSLSTTIATNAIVEGKGGRVGLILIGYDRYNIRKIGFEPKVSIGGKHSIEGDEREPLDTEEARRAVDLLLDKGVDAFAVSSEIGVRNPEFERRVKGLIQEKSALPVVLGSELTRELNCVKRANSAFLNASLIPLVRDLLLSVREVLAEMDVSAPIMVVKGDGTLMSETVAKTNPIDMVLSGPAASSVGGAWLSKIKSGCIVDMGGTTTDVAFIKNGFLKYSREGIRIDSFRTAIRTVDVHTFGLGGDSHIRCKTPGRRVHIGPRRVAPLCWLASQYPEVISSLKASRRGRGDETLVQPADFFLLQRDRKRTDLHPQERLVLDVLKKKGPTHIIDLSKSVDSYSASLIRTERLEMFGDVLRAGLTPTDILHAKGELSLWNGEASRLGVSLYAERMGVDEEEFMSSVMREFYRTLLSRLFRFLMKEADDIVKDTGFSERLISHMFEEENEISLAARIENPVVFIGAPAKSIAPALRQFVNTGIIIPEYHEVANAVGSITGGVCENVTVLIRPHGDDGFVAYAPKENRYYHTLEEAKQDIVVLVEKTAKRQASRAGAKRVRIDVDVQDREARVSYDDSIYLETVVTARLNGVPSIVEH